MATSHNVVAIAAKMVGGRQIKKEADESAEGIKKLGKAVKETDDHAGKTRGWEVFTKKTKEAHKATKEHHSTLTHALKTGASYATGAIGAYGLFDIAKSSIGGVGEQIHELNRLESLGLTGNRQQTLTTLAAYKARGLSAQNLVQASKTLAKSQFTATQQEEKYAQANEKTAFALQKNAIAQEKARAAGKLEQLQLLQLDAAHIKSTAKLGAQANAYKALGINAKEFGKLKGAEQLKLVEDRLSAMPPGLEKVRVATALLGRGGTALLPVLNKGALGLGAMEKAAKEFLPSFGKGTKGMENMEAAQAKLSLATEGLKLRIGLALMPVLIDVIKWFTKLYSNITHGTGAWKGIEKDISAVAGIAKEFIGTIIEVVKWVGKSEAGAVLLGAALVGLGALWGAHKVVEFANSVKKATLFLAFFGDTEDAAAAQATVMWTAITGGLIVAVAGVVLLIKHWSAVKEALSSVFNWVKGHWGLLATILFGPFGFAVSEIIKHWSSIVKFFEGLPSVFAKVGEAIWSALLSSFKWMVNTFIIAPINFVIGVINKMATAYNDLPIHVGTAPHVKPIPALAEGGVIRRAGTALVGERGPELLSLPPYARVDPLPIGQRGQLSFEGAYQSAGSGDLHIHVMVESREIAQAVLREFRKMEARA